jgi:rubrerythrin
MAEEEKGHRLMLLELYEQRFGPNLPPIRREDVKGFLRRRPIWLTRNLPLDTIRKEAEIMDLEAERFYVKAADQAHNVGVRKLLGDLADMKKYHESLAAKLTDTILIPDVRAEEDRTRKRMFILQYVQPGLAGLMDGSVSTLAPCSRPPSPPIRTGRPSSSVSQPRLAPASAWALRKRFPMADR